MTSKPQRITATELQRNFGTIITDVTVDQRTTIVTHHGREQFVMVPLTTYLTLIRERQEKP